MAVEMLDGGAPLLTLRCDPTAHDHPLIKYPQYLVMWVRLLPPGCGCVILIPGTLGS